jgi:hypothetical protein
MSLGYHPGVLPTGPRKLELIAFGFALALVLFVEYLGYRSAEAQVETAGRVDHTHEVLSELDGVLIASVDAETGAAASHSPETTRSSSRIATRRHEPRRTSRGFACSSATTRVSSRGSTASSLT